MTRLFSIVAVVAVCSFNLALGLELSMSPGDSEVIPGTNITVTCKASHPGAPKCVVTSNNCNYTNYRLQIKDGAALSSCDTIDKIEAVLRMLRSTGQCE